MVNGLPGMQNQVPAVLPRLYPTPVSQYDPNPQDTSEANSDQQQSPSRPANAGTSARKGTLTRCNMPFFPTCQIALQGQNRMDFHSILPLQGRMDWTCHSILPISCAHLPCTLFSHATYAPFCICNG